MYVKRKGRNKYNVEPLRQARDLQGLMTVTIARAINRGAATVTRTLNGHLQGPRTVKAIADYLKVPMERLIAQPEEAVA